MTTTFFTRFAPTLLIISFFVSTAAFSQAPVPGCKDPVATNYNAAATANDGSCTYATTTYTPPVKANALDNRLAETSGLQMAGSDLWSINDSGGDPAIYRVDISTGVVLQTVLLQNATNIDWEDMAFDGTYFYIGDIGNNVTGARTDLKIYKFKLSDIPSDYSDQATVTIPANQIDIINYEYSDQPRPLVPTAEANTTAFDCEAMIVDSGKIHLFTKNWLSDTTTHYVINSTNAGTYDAAPVEKWKVGFLVTGADKVPDEKVIALIGYQYSGLANHYMYLLSDFSGGNYFNGNKRKIDLPNAITMGQAEGITFTNTTNGFISNENFTYSLLNVNQKLRSFNIADFVPMYVLPLELKNFIVVNTENGYKISWRFMTPVKNLKIQGSSDGISFADLQTYSTTTTGVYYYTAATAAHCYRLAWQKNNGAYIFSDIVCVKNSNNNTVRNVHLGTNGQLAFTVNGTAPVRYAFKLLTTTGQLLAEMKEQPYSPGAYSVNFLKNVPAGSYVFLIVYNAVEKESIKLWVGK